MNHRHYEYDGKEFIQFYLNDDTTVEDTLALKQMGFLLCKKTEKEISIGSDFYCAQVEIEWDDDRLEALLNVFDFFKKKNLLWCSLRMAVRSLENYGRFTRQIIRHVNVLGLFKELDLTFEEDLDEGENLFPSVTLNNRLEVLKIVSSDHTEMSEEDMNSLGHLLQTTSTLKWLELKKAGYLHNRALLRGLAGNQTLERICIFPNDGCLVDSDFAKLLESISRIPSLRKFHLMYYKLGHLSSKALEKLLEDSMLHTLILFTTSKAIHETRNMMKTKTLVQGMKKTSSLRTLSITGDVFCDPLPFSKILSGVSSCPSLKTLKLRYLELTKEDFEQAILVEKLPHPIVLRLECLYSEHEEEIQKLRQSHPEIQVIIEKEE